ncbi:hypothetical protein [Streptomyces sp. NPDC050504]|uniref:hypothetical protein n=1 Tax=Streptomyces sp. NPDC050504 TaxID=3365618 RepID=UPI0037A34F00
MLSKLRDAALESGVAFSACARAAGVNLSTARLWCRGESAPGRQNTEAVERLVTRLRQAAGEPPVFDDHWRRALEAARQEGEARRGAPQGRVRPLPEAEEPEPRDIARQEWERLRASALGRTLLGLFGAARAGLRLQDLAEAAGVGLPVVEEALSGALGSLLVPDVGSDGAYRPCDGVPLDRDDEHVELLHAWADSWQARGWPEGTPLYLLSRYPELLRGDVRLARVVLDPRRLLRLASEGRLDEALAQLGLVPERRGDLGTTARLAVSRALIAQRARPVPRHLPRLLALAGDHARARALARVSPQAAARAVRLADVAQVLRRAKDPLAEDVAREAAQWAERATADASPLAERNARSEELGESGAGLLAAGLHEAGDAVLRAVAACEAVGWTARIRAAKKVSGEGPEVEGLLPRAAARAAELSEGDFASKAEALEIWAELVAAHGRAGRLARGRVEEFCAGLDPGADVSHIDLLALGAGALMRVRPGRARRLAARARDALLAVLEEPGRRSPSDRARLRLELSETLARVVAVCPGSARELLKAVPEELATDVLGDDVRAQARAGAAAGQDVTASSAAEAADTAEFQKVSAALRSAPDRGRQLLSVALARWEGHAPVAGLREWGLSLAWALAATGHTPQAARLAGRSREPAELAGALAVVSLGCAIGGRRDEAREQVRKALANGRPAADVHGLIAQAFACAGVTGEAAARARTASRGARSAVATGLVAHAPAAAAPLVAARLAEIGTAPPSPYVRERSFPEVVELLLAVPDVRKPCGDLRASLRDWACRRAPLRNSDPQAVLLHALLGASGRYPEVPALDGWLVDWEQYMAGGRIGSGSPPVPEWTVLQAFRGDLPAARATALRARDPGARAAALGALAAYLGRVPVVVPAVDGWLPQPRPLLRYLALADALGGDATRDEGEARRILGELLRGEHWAHALPLLPRLAPEAVPLLGELALVHTGPR